MAPLIEKFSNLNLDHDHSHGWHGKGLLNQSSTSGVRQKRDATTTTTSTSKPPAASGIPVSISTTFYEEPFRTKVFFSFSEVTVCVCNFLLKRN